MSADRFLAQLPVSGPLVALVAWLVGVAAATFWYAWRQRRAYDARWIHHPDGTRHVWRDVTGDQPVEHPCYWDYCACTWWKCDRCGKVEQAANGADEIR